jgi:hypothetical protein
MPSSAKRGMPTSRSSGPKKAPPRPSLESWEDEGGAVQVPAAEAGMLGTVNQIEWAERIKLQVNDEFDRVAEAFRSIAGKQSGAQRSETESVIAILEEKRAEVMARREAGYFIHDWQEIGDQVRQLIFRDPRYQAIQPRRLDRAARTR